MDAHIPAISKEVLVFLTAAVVAPPLFKRLGLGAIIGYLVAGILVGPSALGVFHDPGEVLHIAELGVVLLLFLIGLELAPSHLLAMRRDIIGLGFGQLILTTALIAWAAWAFGLHSTTALVVGFAFALSSTAVAVQLLNERGHLTRPYGQRTFSVLLAQDLAIVPALAIIPALGNAGGVATDWSELVIKVGLAVACLAVIIVSGRYLIDPILRLLSRSGAREVMVSAALLLVAGAAVIAQAGGLSMALGAFLAGLLLAESSYRHELEVSIEPFRGILLALFFMGVGMNLNVTDTIDNAPVLLAVLAALLVVKLVAALSVTRLTGSPWHDAIRAATLLAPTSEFAFVFLPLATREGIMDQALSNGLAAVGVLSMMAGPPLAALVERALRQRAPAPEQQEETFEGAQGCALVIGFGRFSQIAAQLLLTHDVETTLIDGNPDRVRTAARFGFKVYYGDGTRLDVLRAAGAEQARAILVCVEDPEASLKIVDLVKTHFPLAKLLVRSYDRAHTLALLEKDVDFELRELFESSVVFGRAALEALGVDHDTAMTVEADVRRRDLERLALQRVKGLNVGIDLLHQKIIRPEPLVTPEHQPKALSAETETIIRSGTLVAPEHQPKGQSAGTEEAVASEQPA